MNYKSILLGLFSFVFLTFISCNSSDGTAEEWRKDNQAAYELIKANSDWILLDTDDGPFGVYYQDLTSPEAEIGDEYPIETATVLVNYTGKYYNDNIFDSGKKTTFAVNQVVRGFGIALQHMRTGQKWNVCIPYYLGYGVTGLYSGYTLTIQGFTTLFFEIELLQINQYP